MTQQQDLLTKMFLGDLDIAAQFARIGHIAAARKTLHTATEKLIHLQALYDQQEPTPQPAPLPPIIDL